MCSSDLVALVGGSAPIVVAAMAAAPFSTAACSRRVTPTGRGRLVSPIGWMSMAAALTAVTHGLISERGIWWHAAPVAVSYALAGLGAVASTLDGSALPCCSGTAVATALLLHALVLTAVPVLCASDALGPRVPEVAWVAAVGSAALVVGAAAAAASCGAVWFAGSWAGRSLSPLWLGVHEEGAPEMRTMLLRREADGAAGEAGAAPGLGRPAGGRRDEEESDAEHEGPLSLDVDADWDAARAAAQYDRLGSWWDPAVFFADGAAALSRDVAASLLIEAAGRGGASSGARGDESSGGGEDGAGGLARLVDVGCGSGRLAAAILEECSAVRVAYTGLDASGAMVDLATARLARGIAGGRLLACAGAGHAEVVVADATADAWVRPNDAAAGGGAWCVEPGSVDVVLATFVLDAMPRARIAALLAEARRALRPGTGALVVACRSFGATPMADAVAAAWVGAYGLAPALFQGCRPMEARSVVREDAGFRVEACEYMTQMGLTSQVVVARTIAQ